MYRLLPLALASTALLATPALAERNVSVPLEADLPQLSLQAPGGSPVLAGSLQAASSLSARGGMHRPAMGRPPMMHRPGGHRLPTMHRSTSMHRPPMGPHRPGGYHKPGRGQHFNRYWFGPRFHLRNYGFYGLTPPAYGDRWVRYYDDAVLLDRDGRVRDYRGDLDWDARGERWDYADDVPGYADGYYDAEDVDGYVDDTYDDRHRDGGYDDRYDDYDRGSDYGYPAGRTVTTTFQGRRPIEGHYPPGTVITETITTTAPVTTTKTWYENRPAVRYRVKAKAHRRHTRDCNCDYPGERG